MDECRTPGLPARWARHAWRAVGVLASIVALATLAVVLMRPYTHRVAGDEFVHLAKAREGVTAFVAQHARLPRDAEFGDWMRRADAREGTRFDGLGFQFAPRCAHPGRDFYLGFWTGEAWVTWRSWQPDPDVAEINGSVQAGVAEGAACAGLVVLAAFAFSPSRRR